MIGKQRVMEISYSLLACYGLIVMFFARPGVSKRLGKARKLTQQRSRVARVDDLLDPEFLGRTKRRAQQQTAAGGEGSGRKATRA